MRLGTDAARWRPCQPTNSVKALKFQESQEECLPTGAVLDEQVGQVVCIASRFVGDIYLKQSSDVNTSRLW